VFFLLQLLEPLGLVDVHLPELPLPTMKRDFGDVLPPAQFLDAPAAIILPQHANLALRRIPFVFNE
jgi:hypothetical protein